MGHNIVLYDFLGFPILIVTLVRKRGASAARDWTWWRASLLMHSTFLQGLRWRIIVSDQIFRFAKRHIDGKENDPIEYLHALKDIKVGQEMHSNYDHFQIWTPKIWIWSSWVPDLFHILARKQTPERHFVFLTHFYSMNLQETTTPFLDHVETNFWRAPSRTRRKTVCDSYF